jgi:ABC-type transport system involved in Fe-S cluster assembly fused permease/ATPase subunit
MKTSLFKTVLFSILLVLLGQCTYDRPQALIAPRSTAEQLVSNTDFVEMVKITNHFQDVIYNNLRDAHSDKVRQFNGQRISSLLSNRQNKDSLILAINYMGFKDFNQFLVDLNKINSLGVKLNKSGMGLAKVPS